MNDFRVALTCSLDGKQKRLHNRLRMLKSSLTPSLEKFGFVLVITSIVSMKATSNFFKICACLIKSQGETSKSFDNLRGSTVIVRGHFFKCRMAGKQFRAAQQKFYAFINRHLSHVQSLCQFS